MSNHIRFKTGGTLERNFHNGRFIFRFNDLAERTVFTWTRSEILEVVNLLLSTPTTDITPVDRCPQCNGPIDTEQSVTMLLGEGGPKIIACHGCTVVNAKRSRGPTETTIVEHRRRFRGWAATAFQPCDVCGAAPSQPCK